MDLIKTEIAFNRFARTVQQRTRQKISRSI